MRGKLLGSAEATTKFLIMNETRKYDVPHKRPEKFNSYRHWGKIMLSSTQWGPRSCWLRALRKTLGCAKASITIFAVIRTERKSVSLLQLSLLFPVFINLGQMDNEQPRSLLAQSSPITEACRTGENDSTVDNLSTYRRTPWQLLHVTTVLERVFQPLCFGCNGGGPRERRKKEWRIACLVILQWKTRKIIMNKQTNK